MASPGDATGISASASRAGDWERRPKLAEPDGHFRIARAINDLLFDDDGRQYVDLLCGFGSVFLGHCNPAIRARVEEQLGKVWATGRLATAASADSRKLVETFFPPTHQLACLYSTGMEAAEFALRVARVATNRPGVIGFEGSTHGKSMATAYLGWHNDQVSLPEFHRLPFVTSESEAKILSLLAAKLSTRSVSAVFIEPVHGSGNGHSASSDFYRQVSRLCAEHGTLCVFDEILTGFYRNGEAFCFEAFGLVPDIVLIGKTIGNGFPVSGVVARKTLAIEGRALPGSTYSGNPLASTVVAATLSQMRSLDMRGAVARVASIVCEELEPLTRLGLTLRGRGALWILELPSPREVPRVVASIRERGVVVAPAGACIRLLPPATISADHLRAACAAVREACFETDERPRS
jgi:acetylornithine/succinyldiaminopimelate/putrescine aminotransferase